MNKTIEHQWKYYFQKCYTGKIPDSQKVEIRQAFLAGSLATLEIVSEIGVGSDPEVGVKKLEKLFTEVESACYDRLLEMQGRN